jgi:hypothetical protein
MSTPTLRTVALLTALVPSAALGVGCGSTTSTASSSAPAASTESVNEPTTTSSNEELHPTPAEERRSHQLVREVLADHKGAKAAHHSSTSPGDRAQGILSASVDHYERLLSEGEQAIGQTPYPDAQAGLAAMSDPSSPASHFRDYRQHPNPEQDLSYNEAFAKADALYTASDEPAALGAWREHMTEAQSELVAWVQDAASWQISEISTAKLHADAAKVRRDLAAARKDVEQIAAAG